MRLMGYCHPQDVAAFRKALDEKGMGSVPIQEEPALDRGHWYVVDFDEVVRMTKRVYSTGTIRPYTLAEREGEVMGQERKGHVLCVQPEEVTGGSNVSEFRHFSEGPLRCNLCGERFGSLPEVDALPDCTGWKGNRVQV